MEDERELIFTRFPQEKQEQVRGLVAYAQLMGLDGRDLVSIGGKLLRIQDREELNRNMEIAESYECILIGADRNAAKARHEQLLNMRFKLATALGDYRFDYGWTSEWTVTSHATKSSQLYYTDVWSHNLPKKRIHSRTLERYALLLEIHSGRLTLNF